jgi:hypothetical protein
MTKIRAVPNGYPELIDTRWIEVNERAVYAAMLGRTRWLQKSAPQQGTPLNPYDFNDEERIRRFNRIDDHIHLWTIAGTPPHAAALKKYLPLSESTHQHHRELFYLGQENDLAWYGYLTILDFANFQIEMTTPGEELIPVLVRNMAIEDTGKHTAQSCQMLLAHQGSRALKHVELAIAFRLPQRGQVVGALGQSKDEAIAQWLLAEIDSTDAETAIAAKRSLLGHVRPEAAKLYVQWLAEGAGRHQVTEEIRACRLVKAVPDVSSLKTVLAAPTSLQEYRAALEFSHELEGKPATPENLLAAKKILLSLGFYGRPADRPQILEAMDAILATEDSRDAAATGLSLALNVTKGDTGKVSELGTEILRRLPNREGVHFVELIARHNQARFHDRELAAILQTLKQHYR